MTALKVQLYLFWFANAINAEQALKHCTWMFFTAARVDPHQREGVDSLGTLPHGQHWTGHLLRRPPTAGSVRGQA